MRYTFIYSAKDVQRVTSGRFTVNNLNNCYNINKYLTRFAAALDYNKIQLATELNSRAEQKFGADWQNLKAEYDVVF